MRWNELTSSDFMKAIEDSQRVCLFPIGVLEEHGDHFPLGNDYMKAWHFCDLAAEKEKAVVFPPFYFGSVTGACHRPGAFALPIPLLFTILEATFDEIARNGLTKIIVVNAHGGNISLLDNIRQAHSEKWKRYMLYFCKHSFGPRTAKALKDLRERTKDIYDGHGGSYETAVGQHLYPGLMKMDRILPREAGMPENRLSDLKDSVLTPTDWYSDHSTHHLAGYGGDTTPEDGEIICEAISEDLADIIRKVKADTTAMALYDEFQQRRFAYGKGA